MDNTSSVNVPIIGMKTDNHSINLDDRSYRHALNAVVENFDGQGFPVFQNDSSNILAINLPDGFKVIGNKTIIEQDRVILMLVNPTTGASEIGEYSTCQYNSVTDSQPGNSCVGCTGGLAEEAPLETIVQVPYCSYRTIISETCLNFNINFPIDIEYKITDCTLNIYFTDNFNERRYIHFNYEDGTSSSNLVIDPYFFIITGYTTPPCTTPIYSTHLDCNKIKYHPDYLRPCIDFVDVLSGGVLKSGVYQAFFAYADVVGNALSNYTPGTQPIPIFNREITVETNYQTPYAIKFQLSNIEDSGVFLYYNFVIAETIDNFTEFKLLGTFPITTDTQVYSGNNPLLKKLSADEVFARESYYQKAKSVTKSNDYLFFGSLTEFPALNLQPVASLIKFKWETVAIKEEVYSDPKNSFYFRSYMRDEVYPLGLVFETTNGQDLCAIHVPGPSKDHFQTYYSINVDQLVNNNDVINDTTCDPDLRNKNWQVYNLARVTQAPHLYTDNCDTINPWEIGEFAYWESSETYPNIPEIWGDLCGQPIRHHKFPDSCTSHIHDGLDANKLFPDNNMVFPIGVNVDKTSVITALDQALALGYITVEQRARISGYRVIRGNRAQHKSVIAKGLIYDVWSYNKNSKTYYYPNYPYNSLQDDRFIGSSPSTYDNPDTSPLSYENKFVKSGRYTFHSPDTSFTNPKLGSELKLETLEYGKAEGYFNECLLQAKYKFLSTASYVLSLAAGVAAAFSATTEKECTTYKIKSDTKETQDVNGFDYIGTGGSSTNTLTAGNVTEGTGTSGTNGNIDTHIDATKEDTSIGTIREAYNNPYTIPDPNYTDRPFIITNDKVTGQAKEISSNVSADPFDGRAKSMIVDSFTKTTCTGTVYQELNKPGILSVLTGALGQGLPSVQGIYYRISLGLFEMKKVLDLIEALSPKKNFAIQYNSVGKYNNYKCMPNFTGNKRRKIERNAYLDSTIQTIDESINTITQLFTTVNFNNWNRESAVYIKLAFTNVNNLFPDPVVVDNSRFTLGNAGGTYTDLNKTYPSEISSYYASIKNYVPDQYSNIYSVEYLETSSCTESVPLPSQTGTRITNNNAAVVFGGDTFINRFALKRKMPFFTQTAFKFNDQDDIRYQDLGNVGYPNYYLNTPGTLMESLTGANLLTLINPASAILLGVAKNRLDVDTLITFFYQKGYIYLYSYGIPYFFVESDVNVDLRHGENDIEKDFYPHKKDLDFWFQEKNVPITEDNYYTYNTTFSKQNKESVICVNNATFAPNKICKTTFPFRIIYSEQSQSNQSNYDNWLIFKANNFNDFPLTNGELITADGIENDKMLVRFANTTSIFNAYDTIETNETTVQVGSGGIFAARPKQFANTDLGYFGTQHRTLLRTEFGHIWVDAKRGQVFVLGSNAAGVEEISKNGMRNWFKENLPFQIAKDFKNFDPDDLDNNYKGIGLHLSFDKRFNRFLLTKLDYKVIDPRVLYDEGTKQFFYRDSSNIRFNIEVTDPLYFCNKSWTISYNFATQGWVSFHSFIPNVYINWVDYFQTITGNQIWSHNVTHRSYQVYNGILYPFSIDFQTKPTYGQNYLNSIEYMLDVIRYHNTYDWFYKDNITFNKAIVYTPKQCSGLLTFHVHNPDDMSEVGEFPRPITTGVEIETVNAQGFWSFNQFHDCTTSQYNNLPFFNNNCANSNKDLNPQALNYYKNDLDKSLIRGDYHNIILINDKESNYKFILKHITNKSYKSIS